MAENTQLLRTQTTAPLSEARERLSEIVDDVATTGADLVITKHGRPMAVVISYDEYESLIETLNILSDAKTMSALAEAESDLDTGDIDSIKSRRLAKNLWVLLGGRDQYASAGLIG